MLDEVVVVGYGTQKAKDVTGSIGVITPSEISDLPVSNLGAALAGQIPGLSTVVVTAVRVKERLCLFVNLSRILKMV